MLKEIFNHSHYNEIIIERNAYIYAREREKLTIKSKLAKRLSRYGENSAKNCKCNAWVNVAGEITY